MTTSPAQAQSQRDTAVVLKGSLQALSEGITGLAASDRARVALSVGHILQSMRKGQFLSQLLAEWASYRDEGKIKDNYQATEQHFECLQELLGFLDNDSPDQSRFDALKRIFLLAATESASDRESVIPQQFMKVCRRLTSGELLVMHAAYRLAKNKHPEVSSASQWLEVIALESGLKHPSLVEVNEELLMAKHILSGRKFSDASGVFCNPHFRLTTLGFDLCEFLAH